MSADLPSNESPSPLSPSLTAELKHELEHLRGHWWWFLVLGIVLAAAGSVAIAVPAATVLASVTVVMLLGFMLMISGVAIIVAAFWAGKWSGFLLNMLVGLLYFVGGFVVTEKPGESLVLLTVVLSSLFIVLGAFRIATALAYRTPQWGWVLLSGIITLLAGLIIFRHFRQDYPWVIGLLVGLEMLFNGWTWIMLSLAIRNAPKKIA
jgi:uncharacterized membrane protein HdeD (DUF308 family)